MGFLTLEWKVFSNKSKLISWADSLKISVLLLISFVFLFILYQGFFRVLIYLRTIEFIGNIIIIKLLAMIFLTFFIMLVFSNLITSFSTLFFANDMEYLVSLPVKMRRIFTYKLFKTCFYSSWMVLVAFLPFLAAYGAVNNAGFGFYAVVIVFMIPFFLIASALGVSTSMLFLKLFPSKKTRDVFVLIGVALVGLGYVFARWIQPEDFLKADKLNEVVQYVSVIQAPTGMYLPSWWITSISAYYLSGQWGEFAFYTFLIAATAFVAVMCLVFLSDRIYYDVWESVHGSERKAAKFSGIFAKKIFSILPAQPSNMALKDTKIFFRDTSQWSQLLLLLTLVIVYLFNIYKLPLDTKYLKSIISFLNIGFAGFVLAAVSLRFVYPSVSLEGESIWLIKSAPVKIGQYLLGKFCMAAAPLVFFGSILIIFSNYLLGVESCIAWLSLVTVVIVSITLSGMAVGFGAIFPKFRYENVSEIESSAGGMVFMVFSMFYIGLTIAVEAVPVRLWFYENITRKSHHSAEYTVAALAAIIIISAASVIVPLKIGAKKLENIDV